MTMPRSIAKDPRKRREYLQNLCGLPDGQSTFGEDSEEITETKKLKESLRKSAGDEQP
jgi:hypothetical protein